MHKLTKIMMGAGALLFSSVAFLSCSDEDFPKDTLGASFIQAITAGTDYVDLYWTITPTDNVEGYKVEIYTGTIEQMGTLVTSGTFEKKVHNSRFNGLQPDTHYVVATQCIPAEGSKFTKADIAYFEFWSAPVITLSSASLANIQQMLDDKGNPAVMEVPAYDAAGKPIMKDKIDETTGEPIIDKETGEPVQEQETKEVNLYQGQLTLNWAQNLSVQQVAYIKIAMNQYDPGNVKSVFGAAQTPSLSVSNPSATTGTSYTFTVGNLIEGYNYDVSMSPYPSEYSWFTDASAVGSNVVNFTMPKAN